MASMLAGTPIHVVEIKRIRALKSFRNWYSRYRSKILQRLDDARESFESENVPKAIETHKWALEEAQAKGDYRAVGPLVEPAIKALYKHMDEASEKPTIVLDLGGFAQAHLAEETVDVEWEEVHDEPPI